ncbi:MULTISPECIES: hypothetical protein [Paenarthrobacter]|uniref:Uncharacterized protein n=1 Tax=Paenarthrobacter ureafaciens TaxID=37931 RepID=A0AAX3EQM1_PAEUR|nr:MULTISPECIES: hypothetical protein [Paenarthrobacter]MDO5867137.1 hypothetical protein [Paenarthrobacter sp. SD-2]MDO5878349.1 hypothetical protein [Paenarthrobacter sp. SD-1]UYV95577.1 hypothetical protein NL395_23420 [Paenarthrobacter ureafaciens]UYW00261.1 hypothetical protein NL394_24020 [Paenarthrobacter ureafaciens]
MVPVIAPASTHAPIHIAVHVAPGERLPRVPGYTSVQGLPGLWKKRDAALVTEHSKRTEAPRRVNRLTERDEETVLRAIPDGSVPLTPEYQDEWLDLIWHHKNLVHKRTDFQHNVMTVAALYRQAYDFNSHTATPGNRYLRETAGIGKGTLGRVKRWLKRHGFLGQVAGGRSAIYTPKSCTGTSNLYAEDAQPNGRMADRAVYVLCRPATEEELAQFGEEEVQRMDFKCKLDPLLGLFGLAVDINGNPIESKGKTSPKSIKAWASPTLKAYFEAATKFVADMTAARTDLSWPSDGTTGAQDKATRDFNELQAARTVQLNSPPLQKLRSRHLARILAPYFRADYTPDDILHAIGEKPNGTAHRHDGFHGAKDVAQLLQHRLNYWRLNGQPVYPRSKRLIQRSQQLRAQAEACRLRLEKEAAEPRPAAPTESWRTRFADDYQKGLQEAAARGTTR